MSSHSKKDTRSKLLEIDQTSIFLSYIPNFNFGQKFSIRNERTPSCAADVVNGIVYVKDFGTPNKPMDCLNVIMQYENCDYPTAWGIIESKYSNLSKEAIEANISKMETVEKLGLSDVKIHIKEAKEMDEFDISWWEKSGVSKSTLVKYRVNSAKIVSMTGTYKGREFDKKIESFTEDPVFVYNFESGKKKVYCPLRDKKNKWKSNTGKDDIQGLPQLPKCSYMLVITKSLKDVMTLHDMGFAAVAPQSESADIPSHIMDDLKKRFNVIKILYDNDNAGKQNSKNLSEKINVPSIPWSDDLPKDISDTVQVYGVEKAKELFLKHWKDV